MKTKYNWYKKAQLATNILPVLPVQLVQPISYPKSTKTFLEIEKDILTKSEIPNNEIGDYIFDTMANGAILREKAETVKIGKMSIEEAALAISHDWQEKKHKIPHL